MLYPEYIQEHGQSTHFQKTKSISINFERSISNTVNILYAWLLFVYSHYHADFYRFFFVCFKPLKLVRRNSFPLLFFFKTCNHFYLYLFLDSLLISDLIKKSQVLSLNIHLISLQGDTNLYELLSINQIFSVHHTFEL